MCDILGNSLFYFLTEIKMIRKNFSNRVWIYWSTRINGPMYNKDDFWAYYQLSKYWCLGMAADTIYKASVSYSKINCYKLDF